MSTQPARFSFEFFPPHTAEGVEKLRATRAALAAMQPDFFSVTYGAGGSTRDRTMGTVLEMQDAGLETAPHLSCIGDSRAELGSLLRAYQEHGVARIVALRGDLPSGMGINGDFRYANELVEFIRAETGDHFHIEVAAYPEVHPQAESAEADFAHFQRKIEAGANSAITQYFFNADAHFHFMEQCAKAGVTVPVVPGIMPITNYSRLARFSDACGAEIPRWIRRQLESFGDDLDSIRSFGEDVVTGMCERLLAGGAPGLHFYTLNQAAPSLAIWRNLGLDQRRPS